MTGDIGNLLLIAMIALGLLILDRIWRITPMLEGFQGGSEAQCGVDLPPCEHPLRCMNGYCKSQALPYFPAKSDLPVLP
jgi:hypothetical protein